MPGPRSARSNAVRLPLSALSCAGIVGAGIAASELASGQALFLTSLLSSAVLIATAPESRQCHPARIASSHCLATISGALASSALPCTPLAVAAAVGLALFVILFLDVLHPPALANAGYAFLAQDTGVALFELTAATASILALAAILLRQWRVRSD